MTTKKDDALKKATRLAMEEVFGSNHLTEEGEAAVEFKNSCCDADNGSAARAAWEYWSTQQIPARLGDISYNDKMIVSRAILEAYMAGIVFAVSGDTGRVKKAWENDDDE